MYYQGIGNAAHGYKIAIVMDETRFILGYAVGSSKTEAEIQKEALDMANKTVSKYGRPEIVSCEKSRIVSAFFSTLTCECLDFETYRSIKELKVIIDDYIDYYNHERLHSVLKYRTPFEAWQRAISV